MNCITGDDDMAQLDFTNLRHSNFGMQGLLTMGKRPSTSDAETDDSGFGSDMSPPLAKAIKVDEDSSPFCGSQWSTGFVDRRSAFAPASNENCNLIDSSRFYSFSSKYPARSRDGRVELKIVSQPEDQHRARYMTEGSRGAIKDRTGISHPCIKVTGVSSTVRVDCFIGHDKFPGLPHLFYQASRINGKNATRCTSSKIDGTSVISFDVRPEAQMMATVDCVGILKERNVDVEQKVQRLKNKGEQCAMTKKRSTKCRLVFRCEVPDTKEVLMVVSDPILCTQPAGCPEIAKKSTEEADVAGGPELFMIGKNFVKDCKVVWQSDDGWVKSVDPNREFLHSTHIVCSIPSYNGPDIRDRIGVKVFVRNSDGKCSERQAFHYTRRPMIEHCRIVEQLTTSLPDMVTGQPASHASLLQGHQVTVLSDAGTSYRSPGMSQAQDSHCNEQTYDVFVSNCTEGPIDFQSTFMQGVTNNILAYGQDNQASGNTSACLFPQNSAFPVPPLELSHENMSHLHPDFLCPNPCSQTTGTQLSAQQALSINAMTRLSNNELMSLIDTGTFES